MTTLPRVPGRARAAVVLRALLAAVVTLLATAVLASPAAADDDASSDPEDRFRRYAVDVVVGADGVADVTVDLTVDFGEDPNRGPVLTYVVKQPFPEAEEPTDRVYRLTGFEVSSPTGAATETHVEEEGALLLVRIGEEDRDDFTGVHEYRITFRAEGWVNSASYFEDLSDDQLDLNVAGDFRVPIDELSVSVTGPADTTDAGCWIGVRGSEDACADVTVDGPTATFTDGDLGRRTYVTVRTHYPPGTFAGVEPILQDRWTLGTAFALTPATGAVTALVAAAGIGHAVRRIRRDGRDQQFLDLTPGLTPVGGDGAPVGPRRRTAVTVQFTPPSGLRPGELGTLVDEKADPHDVTATLIDLAVRGYLRIEQTTDEDDDTDWRLVRLREPDAPLVGYERTLLDEVFEDRTEVTLSELRTTFASAMATVQSELYEEVTDKGWFRHNPESARNRWAGAGIGILLGGVVVTALLALLTSWALVGVAVVVVGVVVLAMSGRAPARTATGTAVLVQTEGFRHYLATAEADQIRFEEGEDLFSRYLPFAVAFGLTERWAKVFADLAAQGHDLPEPTWYTGSLYAHGAFWSAASSLSTDLSSFTTAADTSFTAPTPGSSGSGGGGFAGGGVGGAGGGTW